jgi:hypothetical protein
MYDIKDIGSSRGDQKTGGNIRQFSTCWDSCIDLFIKKASGEKLQEEVFKLLLKKQQHY